MRIVHTIKELRELLKEQRRAGKRIGFVPTMGALHEGHLSLIRQSAESCDYTVLSIFINPIQFGENEDLDKYPRDLEGDSRKAEGAGADLLFHPSPEEMLGGGLLTYVDMKRLPDNLCGAKREGHFRGVCTIVAKFFNIVAPDRAFFGKKDIQQLYIIKKMVDELNFDLEIVPGEIVRSEDGLALSSRNVYLSPEEHNDALVLNRSLKEAALLIEKGEKTSQNIINMINEMIIEKKSARIDYIKIVNSDMEDVEIVSKGGILALAVFIGSTRLIDNHIIGEEICF